MPRNGERGPDKRPRKGSPGRGRKVDDGGKSPSKAKQSRLIALVTTEYMSPRQAAAAIGIHENTAYRWLQLPEIAAEVARRCALSVEAARSKLKASATAAADALVALALPPAEEPAPVLIEGQPLPPPRRRERVDPGRVRALELVLARAGLDEPIRVEVELTTLTEEERTAKLRALLATAAARRAEIEAGVPKKSAP